MRGTVPAWAQDGRTATERRVEGRRSPGGLVQWGPHASPAGAARRASSWREASRAGAAAPRPPISRTRRRGARACLSPARPPSACQRSPPRRASCPSLLPRTAPPIARPNDSGAPSKVVLPKPIPSQMTEASACCVRRPSSSVSPEVPSRDRGSESVGDAPAAAGWRTRSWQRRASTISLGRQDSGRSQPGIEGRNTHPSSACSRGSRGRLLQRSCRIASTAHHVCNLLAVSCCRGSASRR
mmetsp:Transcript_42184/g.133189  ORF Transcript_42184/g.133189 Transcript_42184/m.133189 type:complete len:241 (+) Transcript_42184:526-1248(+)